MIEPAPNPIKKDLVLVVDDTEIMVRMLVEILSPDDRFSEVTAKCEEYHTWGVPMAWIIDPVLATAWEFPSGGRIHEVPSGGSLTASQITISLRELFAVLD